MNKLYLIGCDQGGLAHGAGKALSDCACAFAAKRLLPLLDDYSGNIHPLTPVKDALKLISEKLVYQNVAVLASGDPLFFGIGKTIFKKFGTDSIEVLPALSSMQLAFAKVKMSWDDAVFLSLHGRTEHDLISQILRHKKIFLFTDSRNTPAAIAQKLLKTLKKNNLKNPEIFCRFYVAADLGTAQELITSGSPEEIAHQSFSDLNVVIISREQNTESQQMPLGLYERDIRHSRGLITKDEVRAAVLHKLRLPMHGVFWDIGAGSGSISIEAAGICPGLTIFAVEQTDEGQQNIAANITRFDRSHPNLIKGKAPDVLVGLPQPDRVFIGGSGGRLAEIIEAVAAHLLPGGIVIVTAVIESTREAAPRLLHNHGFSVQLTTVQVTRSSYPPSPEGETSLNPITIITAKQKTKE